MRVRTIDFTVAASPLGQVLLAATASGVCRVALGDDARALEAELRGQYPTAEIQRDDRRLRSQIHSLLAHLRGRAPRPDLPLDVRATVFQRKVWRALRAIPSGETRTYKQVAKAIGAPTASRAVARACATNPVALLIPCHRVIRTDGAMGGYRWGVARKRRLLTRERRVRAKSNDSR